MRKTGGLRADTWTPPELECLPDEAADDYATLLNTIEDQLCWPVQSALNKVMFLLKPTGDDRNIGLGSTLFSTWQRVRAPYWSNWDALVAKSWDFAGKGKGALVAAYARAAAAESAVLRGLAVGCVCWDLTSFFDSVRHEILIPSAKEMAFR